MTGNVTFLVTAAVPGLPSHLSKVNLYGPINSIVDEFIYSVLVGVCDNVK